MYGKVTPLVARKGDRMIHHRKKSFYNVQWRMSVESSSLLAGTGAGSVSHSFFLIVCL